MTKMMAIRVGWGLMVGMLLIAYLLATPGPAAGPLLVALLIMVVVRALAPLLERDRVKRRQLARQSLGSDVLVVVLEAAAAALGWITNAGGVLAVFGAMAVVDLVLWRWG